MTRFMIIETEAGLTVGNVSDAETTAEAATRQGGIIVDPGPYPTYEEACEALVAIPDDDDADEVT